MTWGLAGIWVYVRKKKMKEKGKIGNLLREIREEETEKKMKMKKTIKRVETCKNYFGIMNREQRAEKEEYE